MRAPAATFLIVLFILGGCRQQDSQPMFFKKSPVTKGLETWIRSGGELREHLPREDRDSIRSVEEARAVCAALNTLRQEPARATQKIPVGSPLHILAALFQSVEDRKAIAVLRDQGLPHLRHFVQAGLEGDKTYERDLLFVLKILAMYGQRDDVDLVVRAARHPIEPGGYMWSVIMGQFDDKHPHAVALVESLREPLPTSFILVAYLDLANGHARTGKIARHPFDSAAGADRLLRWIEDHDPDHFSYAHSATAALPFIGSERRERLLQAAGAHPDMNVRLEADWANAKLGNAAAIDRLVAQCLDARYSVVARRYLEELGHDTRIPAQAKEPKFEMMAEMSNWLAHPNEFGRPPDKLEPYDFRELHWPPTNDRRQVALFKYTYEGKDGESPDVGLGMVGSVTFALFGEASVDLSPEDAYGLHCAWELEMNGDKRAPAERSAASGRKVLAKHNRGF